MKLRSFKCDGCGKESTTLPEKKDTQVFPYDDNWVFIYNLEFKTAQDETFKRTDLHFCGHECIRIFMTFEVAKERDRRRKRDEERKSLFPVREEESLQEEIPT